MDKIIKCNVKDKGIKGNKDTKEMLRKEIK